LKLIFRFLPEALVTFGYSGLVWFWLDVSDSPLWLSMALVLLGLIPVGAFLIRRKRREYARASVWSAVQAHVGSSSSTLTFEDVDDGDVGTGRIGGVRFRGLKVFVSAEGIQINRLHAFGAPLKITWDQVQRFDRLKMALAGRDGEWVGARISLKGTSTEISLIPLSTEVYKLVPEHIGRKVIAIDTL